MKVQFTNQNFKGYSNIVSHVSALNSGEEFGFMSMVLDNKNTNDLDTFRGLKKEAGFTEEQINNDVLVLTRVTAPYNGEFLSFNEALLPNGQELLMLERNNAKNATLVKKVSLKICTFLANITKRVAAETDVRKDTFSSAKVADVTHDVLARHGADEVGFLMICHALSKPYETYNNDAKYFNRVISKRLAVFFK